MNNRTCLCASLAALTLVSCSGPSAPGSLADVASASYKVNKSHAFLVFKVPHAGGISNYRVTLTDYEADLTFDAATPENSSISVRINPLGVQTNYTGDYKATHSQSPYASWNEDLARSDRWLNADAYPAISFVSTKVEKTGDMQGKITGDLSFLGLTRPITLDVTYNGVTNQPWTGKRDIIGFDASTSLIRSEWGMSAGLPNIGDKVEIAFTGEFLQAE